MRKRYIQHPETFELIPAEDYYAPVSNAPYVIPDIQPYQSMQTGEIIKSRSHHREHLRQHGLVEIGNEIKAAMTKPKPKDDREGRKQAIAQAMHRLGY